MNGESEHSRGQAHSHAHSLRDAGAQVSSSRTVRIVTFALLALVALATAVGFAWLWPDYATAGEAAARASYQAEGVRFENGEILSVEDCAEPDSGVLDSGVIVDGAGPDQAESSESVEPADSQAAGGQSACQQLGVGLRSGPDAGRLVDVTVRGTLALSGLGVGDRIELSSFPVDQLQGDHVKRDYALAQTYEVSGIVRHLPLVILVLLFAGVVIAVGRLRGFFALLALGVAAGVLLGFVLPGLVAGGPALLIGLVGSSAIMFVTLFFVHGPNMRTTSALIGTLAGILIISAVSWIAVRVTHLSGLGDEASGLLSSMASEIDFRGLLTCSILIAGLGVLNDVTITQASSVWELRAAAPEMSRREIYARAMRIGRDHIASTVYTVFFAYAGAALSTLLLLYLYNRPVLSLLTQEDIAIEIVRTMAGSIGLVLAVPITTAVAALFVPPGTADRAPRWRTDALEPR